MTPTEWQELDNKWMHKLGEFVGFLYGGKKVLLDGEYGAIQLRQLADKMDQLVGEGGEGNEAQ